MKKIMYLVLLLASFSTYAWADDFGAAGAEDSENFTIESMLKYAIEDEYLALTEYEALIEKLDLDRPYTNIIRAEQSHINYLEKLYTDYNLPIPEVNTDEYLFVPGSALEAAEIGVEAEVNNIAMYEKFLKEDLPDDIREVFDILKRGSENHLKAFERQLDTPQGRGRNRNS